jgi:hypothetical protein
MNNIIKYLLEFGESVTANAVQNMPDTMSLKKYNLYKEAGGNVPPLPKLNSESSPNYNVGLIKNEEMPLSYTERASIRVSCRRLASVFRLADFCIRDTYYSSLENSLTELYKYITKENVLKREKETNLGELTAQFTVDEESKEKNEFQLMNDIELIDKIQSIDESYDLKEIQDFSPESLETFTLKKPNEVYFQLYKDAKTKAKQAKKSAILAYLEAKQIKKTYLLDNLNDSDSEFDEEIEEVSESELEGL